MFALLASLAAAVVAGVWLAAPDTYPYGSGDIARAGVNHLIEREPAVVMLLTFCCGGDSLGGHRPWATPAAARRWGRTVTIAAALCPVPYGLVRLTWLTPWPLGGNGSEEVVVSHSLDANSRIRGSLFALAVAVGVVLTLGLISRWGEVFPRWVPVLGGRTVPVKLAVVPGTLVATVITLSAPGLLMTSLEDGLLEAAYRLFFFPFPIWGPLLGAAVYAYWLRRTHGPDSRLGRRPVGVYELKGRNDRRASPDRDSCECPVTCGAVLLSAHARSPRQISRGCNPPDTINYCPDQSVTREQMASTLIRGLVD